MNLLLTPAAETFMRRMVRLNHGTAQDGFRLTVSAGGCSGFTTSFSIEASPQPGDATHDANGLHLFLTPESCVFLEGATIDFRDASGLAIVNPNVSDCSCGSSGAGRGGRHATISVASIRRSPT